MVLIAFLTGHTLVPQQQVGQVDDRTKAYEELVKQLEESEGGSTGGTAQAEKEKPVEQQADLDHYIIYGLIVALIPYSIDRFSSAVDSGSMRTTSPSSCSSYQN